jgi:hypothetical protein
MGVGLAARCGDGLDPEPWVTPGDAKRKVVGVERLSSVNVAASELKSVLAGGGEPRRKGRMLLSGMC